MQAGFDPDSFWRQTERNYTVALEAAASRLDRETRLANLTAWNTASLGGAAFMGKLRTFEEHFPSSDGEAAPGEQPNLTSEGAAILSAMFKLKARGANVKIERLTLH